ncbi:MAG: DNA repair protein [Moritella sp.]|uniref:DNA repair protein n=1 Tax=Moritella sp. TaxID=78556 RepID=UPI0029A14C12|nr:DNA repair protein [Moritella sp.]MDX2319110.1 DNA repair protein [Moritella sp.]
MKLTFIVIAIAVLLFLVIGYNIILQFKRKAETEKRQIIIKHKQVIQETEELLLNATSLPYSKVLTLVLNSRMHDSLTSALQMDPGLPQIRQRLTNVKAQMAQLKEAPGQSEEKMFRSPNSDREAIVLLQQIKKIRAVLRAEHAKSKLNTQTFVIEDRKLELMQLNVNIDNLLKRAYEARATRQFGSCKQLLRKGIDTLNSINDKNEVLTSKQQTLVSLLSDVNEQLTQASSDDLKDRQEKEDEKNELDLLFQPKQKW